MRSKILKELFLFISYSQLYDTQKIPVINPKSAKLQNVSSNVIYHIGNLTLLHSERAKLYTILAFLSATGLNNRINSVDPDEVAHYEPPHLNLPCLQVQLFSFLELLRLALIT